MTARARVRQSVRNAALPARGSGGRCPRIERPEECHGPPGREHELVVKPVTWLTFKSLGDRTLAFFTDDYAGIAHALHALAAIWSAIRRAVKGAF